MIAPVQAEPAVTITAPAHTRVIERAELSRWTRATKREERALEILIRGAWWEGEAREQGTVVTAREVRERLREENHRTAEPLTRADVVRQQRAKMAREVIRERIGAAAAQSVTPEQIAAYVDAHPRTDPETRSLRIVLTRNARAARRAKNALQRRVTWRTVARRHSHDGQRTLLRRVTRDELPARLRTVAFEADRGKLIGPIRTQHGFYVFKVVEVIPERPTPRRTQEAAAWEILASEAQQNALRTFQSELIAKWRPRTVCAPDLLTHRICKPA